MYAHEYVYIYCMLVCVLCMCVSVILPVPDLLYNYLAPISVEPEKLVCTTLL